MICLGDEFIIGISPMTKKISNSQHVTKKIVTSYRICYLKNKLIQTLLQVAEIVDA